MLSNTLESSSRRPFYALCLLLIILCLTSSLSRAQAQNPQVPQGSNATFAKSGTSAPASGSWDIVLSGTTVATSSAANGWSVSFNMGTQQFTVGAPLTASVATNYTVRYSFMMSGISAVFDVIPPPTPSTLILLPNPVSGGNSVTGTVTLTGNAPTGGAVVTLSKDNNIVTIPASVTVSAGQKSANFTITTSATQTSVVANITATYNSTGKTAALTITPPNLSAITVTPGSLVGGYGNSISIKVTLDGPSPFSGGSAVSITFSPLNTLNLNQGTILTVPAGATSVTSSGIWTSTVNYPTQVAITATMGTETQGATITLNPGNFRVTNVYMPNTVRLEWPCSATGNFLIYRNSVLIATLANSVHLYNDTTITPGSTYLYELVDSNSALGYGYDPLGAEQVTVYGVNVTDNQTVDSRLDLRYSSIVYQDFQYGVRTYKGGLFAGFSTDNSCIGRSFLKFPLSAWTNGTIYRVGNVCAYFTGANSSGGSTVTATIGAQALTNATWSQSSVVWDTAPTVAITSDTVFQTLTYVPSAFTPSWTMWPMDNAIQNALLASSALNVALVAQNETSPGWVYFAKKEYGATTAPTLMYALVTPLVINVTSASMSVKNGQQFTVNVIVNGLGPGNSLPITFTSACNNCTVVGSGPFNVTPFSYTFTFNVTGTAGSYAVVDVTTPSGVHGILSIPITQ